MYWDYSENLRKHVMKIKKIVLDGIASGNGNGNYSNRSTNYRSRTASMTREQQDEKERRRQMIQRDVIQLFDEGYNVDQVAYFLEGYVSPSEVARIAEYNQRRRKFLMTGNLDLPGQMAGITIG